MNKEQSTARKMKRSPHVKSFADQVDKEMQDRKNKVKEMPIWKKIGGILLLPLMIAIWLIDRVLFLLMPHSSHPSFKQYLLEKSSLKMTIARLIIFGIPAFIVWMLF